MNATGRWAVWSVLCVLVGCSATPTRLPSSDPVPAAPGQVSSVDADADVARVLDGVHMIQAGHIQAAIDGPFDEVAHAYEARYAHSKETIYSARGTADALLYASMGAVAKPPVSSVVIGPAWAMAYWGRGYAYNEMARYDDAIVELRKALALAPFDSQYNIELAFAYQRKGQWETSLDLYRTAEAYVEISMPEATTAEITCKAFRGQGYDLVELHRYEEARAAYEACLKLMPGESRSLGELKYIDGLQAKARAPG